MINLLGYLEFWGEKNNKKTDEVLLNLNNPDFKTCTFTPNKI